MSFLVAPKVFRMVTWHKANIRKRQFGHKWVMGFRNNAYISELQLFKEFLFLSLFCDLLSFCKQTFYEVFVGNKRKLLKSCGQHIHSGHQSLLSSKQCTFLPPHAAYTHLLWIKWVLLPLLLFPPKIQVLLKSFEHFVVRGERQGENVTKK